MGIFKIHNIVAHKDLLQMHPQGLHLNFKLGPQHYTEYFNKANNSDDRCKFLFERQAEESLIIYS